MRVSEETLNRGWVCMGWWVSELLLGVHNNITHQQHFLVSYYVGGSFIIAVFQHKSQDRCHC